ncbi:hypothetical protein ASZ78_007204 [Callipepla squamata]|uniref:Uncharacterized protein n=1 Tax=Callipepla squamata TaxID=9009 RepID=A0A226N181_CALSU|nr:hypothetical protein ASZ78_007204 [Callipepla squamata]
MVTKTDSESVYCGHLHLISDLLQAVFKETYSLQKQLMELFDQISVGSASSEDDITDMVSVIHTVLEICSVISNMDHALHANTWKFIIKQSLKHHSLLQCHLKHSDILSGLCKDTLLSFQSSLQLAEEMKMSEIQDGTDLRLFQKTVKLCRFFANSLVYYTKEYALLDAVLGSSMITSLLAMDSWCFLARYGSAELCAHHSTVIAHLVEFACRFLPEEVENLAVWQHVSLRALNADLGKRVAPDQTWLVHQRALEAFRRFAEETVHEDVVPQCLNSEEIKNKVVDFMAKVRQGGETTEARIERLKQERITCGAHFMRMAGELEPPGEPLAKRACHPPSEEQYKSAVGTMEGAVEAVKLLLQKGSPPAWVAAKLEALHSALAILRDSIR